MRYQELLGELKSDVGIKVYRDELRTIAPDLWRSRPALLDAKPSAAGNIFAGRVRTASEGQGSPWRQLRIRDQRQQCTAQLGERGDHEERDATQCQALPALRILEGATPETHGLPGGERRR